MAAGGEWDTKEVEQGLTNLDKKLEYVTKIALFEAGGELLRQSTQIVPHDKGILQSTGSVYPSSDPTEVTVYVGYDTPYALRLHEHPEYRFQKGRQGKYLETPAKQNAGNWQELVYQIIYEKML